MPAQYVPIAILFWVSAIMAVVMLAFSYFLGPRRSNPAKLEPYESGIEPLVSVKRRFPVRFSLVAMLFILFDIEIIFLYPWAVTLRQFKLFALVEMLAFVAVLAVGYIYVWKKGAFDWE